MPNIPTLCTIPTLVAIKMTNFLMILLSLFVLSDLSFIVLHLLSPLFKVTLQINQ